MPRASPSAPRMKTLFLLTKKNFSIMKTKRLMKNMVRSIVAVPAAPLALLVVIVLHLAAVVTNKFKQLLEQGREAMKEVLLTMMDWANV